MRILLVEDDANQLEPLHAALSAAGHIVDSARDGAIAQWILSKRGYDLLILDWLLPQVSGLSLCQHYRRLGKLAPVLSPVHPPPPIYYRLRSRCLWWA